MSVGSLEYYKTMFTLPLGLQERYALIYMTENGASTALDIAKWLAAHEPCALSLDRSPRLIGGHMRVVLHRLGRRLKGSGYKLASKRGGNSTYSTYRIEEEGSK